MGRIARGVLILCAACVGVGYFVCWFIWTPACAGLLVPAERHHELSRLSPALVFTSSAIAVALLSAWAVLIGRLRDRTTGEAIANAARASRWLFLLPLLALSVEFSPLWSREGAFPQTILFLLPTIGSLSLAGWLAGLWNACTRLGRDDRAAILKVLLAGGVYAIVMTTLQWRQLAALHVPHGDSGMYEEHLWNLLEGKGFRSQLDDGRLFFGEHFQFVHLVFLPVYAIWRSLETLLLLESAAIAAGGLAVYAVARRVGLTPGPSWRLALAYYLYFPLQHLDMEASWKVLRPESLGVPIVLGGLALLEGKRFVLGSLLLAASWTAKEDFAVPTAAIGVYFFFARVGRRDGTREMVAGLSLAAVSVLFLAFVLEGWIPYFRGDAPHYAPYFQSLGGTPSEIASAVVHQPSKVLDRIARLECLRFLELLLAPLAFVPLASPGRLLVAAPVLGYLMLGEREGMVQPWFHFHAPIVPILFWAAAAGIQNASAGSSPAALSRLVATMALITGVWFGRSPLSWQFHDPLSGTPTRRDGDMVLFEPRGAYWRDVYRAGARSASFARVKQSLRPTDRVAATDYVRAHLTHFAAAHDYPTLRAHVKPLDVDAIVLDKTEGWWGRGSSNPDRELLACMRDPACAPGRALRWRGRPFVVAFHDPYFLVARAREK